MAASMREAFRKAASEVFDAFGDVVLQAVYVSRGAQAYDSGTGAIAWTDTEGAVRLVKEASTAEKLGRFAERFDPSGRPNVYGEEVVGLVPEVDLGLAGVRPKKGDRVRVAGVEYTVEGFFTDPAEAVWNLWLVR